MFAQFSCFFVFSLASWIWYDTETMLSTQHEVAERKATCSKPFVYGENNSPGRAKVTTKVTTKSKVKQSTTSTSRIPAKTRTGTGVTPGTRVTASGTDSGTTSKGIHRMALSVHLIILIYICLINYFACIVYLYDYAIAQAYIQ